MESLIERNESKVYEAEKKKRRIRVIITIAVCIIAAAAAFVFIANLLVNKQYNAYEVISTEARQDSSTTKYMSYNCKLLKYSRDGASAKDVAGNDLWNGSYDFVEPQADTCGNYVAVADTEGKQAYVYNGSDSGTLIEEELPIRQIEVAEQGVVAMVLEDKESNEIHIYNPYAASASRLLAEIPTNVSNDGYPIDISLSNDGSKLITGYVSISNGILENKITFYNFGIVGQDKENRIVGGEELGETLISQVEFVNNNTACIFLENGFILYDMEQVPEKILEETFKESIKSIFYNENYIGVVLEQGESESAGRVFVYDIRGNKQLDKTILFDYNTVEMQNEELIFLSDQECYIWRVDGGEKFHYKFNKNVHYIVASENKEKYIFVTDTTIDTIKLTTSSD